MAGWQTRIVETWTQKQMVKISGAREFFAKARERQRPRNPRSDMRTTSRRGRRNNGGYFKRRTYQAISEKTEVHSGWCRIGKTQRLRARYGGIVPIARREPTSSPRLP